MEKYPTLSLTELDKVANVLEHAKADPKYLDGRIAPYDKKTRDLLKSMIPDPIVAATVPDAKEKNNVGRPSNGPAIPMGELEKEFDDLRKEIQQLKTDATGLEPHERIQVIKTRAALIEKILSMKERIGNINKVDRFMALTISVIEDELPQEARLRVIDKFADYKEEEN